MCRVSGDRTGHVGPVTVRRKARIGFGGIRRVRRTMMFALVVRFFERGTSVINEGNHVKVGALYR